MGTGNQELSTPLSGFSDLRGFDWWIPWMTESLILLDPCRPRLFPAILFQRRVCSETPENGLMYTQLWNNSLFKASSCPQGYR